MPYFPQFDEMQGNIAEIFRKNPCFLQICGKLTLAEYSKQKVSEVTSCLFVVLCSFDNKKQPQRAVCVNIQCTASTK